MIKLFNAIRSVLRRFVKGEPAQPSLVVSEDGDLLSFSGWRIRWLPAKESGFLARGEACHVKASWEASHIKRPRIICKDCDDGRPTRKAYGLRLLARELSVPGGDSSPEFNAEDRAACQAICGYIATMPVSVEDTPHVPNHEARTDPSRWRKNLGIPLGQGAPFFEDGEWTRKAKPSDTVN